MTRAKIVCGIDPSLTSTGLAKISGERILDTALIKTSGKSGERYEVSSRRISDIASRIATFCKGADLIVIEGPSFRSVPTSIWERAGLFYRCLEYFTDSSTTFAVAPPPKKNQQRSGRPGQVRQVKKPSWTA